MESYWVSQLGKPNMTKVSKNEIPNFEKCRKVTFKGAIFTLAKRCIYFDKNQQKQQLKVKPVRFS